MTTTIVDAHGWWFLIRVAVARRVGFQRSAMAHRGSRLQDEARAELHSTAAADQQRDKTSRERMP
jgi:hypothetical protein